MSGLKYQLLTFQGVSGYLLDPRLPGFGQRQLALGHTQTEEGWSDAAVHLHTIAEEYYILRQGNLIFLINSVQVSLMAGEALMVHPGVPHAIVGGKGHIEHIGIRAPGILDKREISPGGPGEEAPSKGEDPCGKTAWGYHLSLEKAEHQNCWLFGRGQVRYPTCHLALAYLRFEDAESANAGIGGPRHRRHYHADSWEYYVVFRGQKRLWVEGEFVELRGGELLEIPPGVCHGLEGREAPFEGITMRTPIVLDDKVNCDVRTAS